MHHRNRFVSFRDIALTILLVVAFPPIKAQFVPFGNLPPQGSIGAVLALPNPTSATDELAYYNHTSQQLKILSWASGSPSVVATTSIPAASAAFRLAGDVDSDGDADLIVADEVRFAVWQRTASGVVLLQGPIANAFVPQYASRPALIDWDSDGDLDVVHNSSVFINSGNGIFSAQAPIFETYLEFRGIHVDDVDDDGDVDLLAWNADTLTLYRRDAGSLVAVATWPLFANFDVGIRVLDVDLDGVTDIFRIDANGQSAVVSFLKGLGGGVFAAPVFWPAPPNYPFNTPVEYYFGDVDGDMRDEIMVMSVGNPVLANLTYVYGIDTGGSLSEPIPGSSVLSGLMEPIALRLNGDDRDDLAGKFGALIGGSGDIAFYASVFPEPLYAMRVVGGPLPAISSADPIGLVEIEVIDLSTGQPVSGVPISLSADGGVSLSLIGSNISNALGRVSFSLAASDATGQARVLATAASSINLSIPVKVVPPATLSVVSGQGQFGYVGGDPVGPIVFAASRPDGSPWVGGAIAIGTSPSLLLPPGSNVVITDANGQITVQPSVIGVASPLVSARIGTGPLAATASVAIAGRNFNVVHAAGQALITFIYNHEDGPTPLLIAADFPRAPAPTPFGSVATSILAPLPGLVVLDGLGVFGAPNTTLVANPILIRSFNAVTPALFGTTLVFQAYGLDFDYSFPQYVFMTPAITRVM